MFSDVRTSFIPPRGDFFNHVVLPIIFIVLSQFPLAFPMLICA